MSSYLKYLSMPCAPLLARLPWGSRSSPSIEEQLEKEVDDSEKKIEDLNISLQATIDVIKQQNELYKKATGTEKARLHRVLKGLLQKKSQFERQINIKTNSQQNLSEIQVTTELLNDSSQSFRVMRQGQRHLQRTTSKFNPEDVEDMQSEMKETMGAASNILDVFSTPLNASGTMAVDDDNFDALLEDVVGSDDTPSITRVPSTQQREPSAYLQSVTSSSSSTIPSSEPAPPLFNF
jgi:hypothetical protein